MSAIPAFEIGVWNAWIPTTLLFLFIMLSRFFPKDIGKRITPAKEDGETRKVMLAVFFIMIIYSIFLPLKIGSIWFYAGLAVYILGFIISFAAIFSIAATKPGEPFTTGMYRYSRHPIALGTILPMVGAGLASTSWLFLLFSVFLMVTSHLSAIAEERATTKKFGDVYEKYIARTPRWLGLPKSG
ncbi:MAG: isoprenylcysteine carboxylmethyltransferase family protein [Candidatus Aminicenantes bacterium]|nr:isoprenylcysteine carboxylmethyltransferase family protein [Candidatus Aminicenantes bacterium]